MKAWPMVCTVRAASPLPVKTMPSKEPSRALAGVYVLVVEDDDDSRTILTAVLRYYGAHVVATSSAEAGLDRLKVLRPNVVVTDIVMPGRDGLWLLRELKALPDADQLAVVAVTAVAEPAALLAAGFDALLTKPVDPQALCDLVQRALELES